MMIINGWLSSDGSFDVFLSLLTLKFMKTTFSGFLLDFYLSTWALLEALSGYIFP